jgi:hypothetical protein
MGSKYDIRDALGYKLYGLDAAFQYRDFSVTSELAYGLTDIRTPVLTSSGSITCNSFSSSATTSCSNILTVDLPNRLEVNWGYYVQAAFPIHKPAWLTDLGLEGRLIGVLGYNWMQRRGPELERLSAGDVPGQRFLVNGVEFSQINALTGNHIVRSLSKYTVAINDKITDFFTIKLEFSYWAIQVDRDVNQLALAAVLQF